MDEPFKFLVYTRRWDDLSLLVAFNRHRGQLVQLRFHRIAGFLRENSTPYFIAKPEIHPGQPTTLDYRQSEVWVAMNIGPHGAIELANDLFDSSKFRIEDIEAINALPIRARKLVDSVFFGPGPRVLGDHPS